MRRWLCRDCGKTVRDKPIIGTLHICLTEIEIMHRRMVLDGMRAQIENQKRVMAEGDRTEGGQGIGLT